MSDKERILAEEALGGATRFLWRKQVGDCFISSWEQSTVDPAFHVVVARSPQGMFVASRDKTSFERFIRESNLDTSNVSEAIHLIGSILPGTRRILFKDPIGEFREKYKCDWRVPEFKDGALTFFCNHGERGIVERWTIKDGQVLVDDFAKGEFMVHL